MANIVLEKAKRLVEKLSKTKTNEDFLAAMSNGLWASRQPGEGSPSGEWLLN